MSTETTPIAIIGAGFAGVGMAIRLARSGRRDFVLLERADELGGTWRDNRYPGVACDIPSHLYSFSFAPNPGWSSRFAPGAEILDYLQRCAAEEGILDRLRLGCALGSAVWNESERVWELDTSRGPLRAAALVLAVGRLSEPLIPELPGLPDFPGAVMHTADWHEGAIGPDTVVGVVGTGASAVQLLPGLVERANRVVVFQRSAVWVVPRGDRAYDESELQRFRDDPSVGARLREELFHEAETGIAARTGDKDAHYALRETALTHLARQVPDASTRAVLTPDYEIGCKRVALSDDYFPAVTHASVTLEPSALAGVEGAVAVAESGARHAVDVLVFATGYRAANPSYAATIAGRGGRTLSEAWRDGMMAHLSTVVHGFPNLFVLDGPNASLGHNSALEMIEIQVGYVLEALAHLAATSDVLDAEPEAQQRYVAEIDARASNSVWLTGGCGSWYVDPGSGRLALLWPGSATEFRERLARFELADYSPEHPTGSARPASLTNDSRHSADERAMVLHE